MANKVTIKLSGPSQRARACNLIMRAPDGHAVSISEPSRSLDQNALLWALLSDVAKAEPDGRNMTAEHWKCAFMDAAGFRASFVPDLDGDGFLCLGYKSSRLKKSEFSDLIETILEFGARKGIEWTKQPMPEEYK